MQRAKTIKLFLGALALVLVYLIIVQQSASVTRFKSSALLTNISNYVKTMFTTKAPSKMSTNLPVHPTSKPILKVYDTIYQRPSDLPEFFIPRPVVVNPMNFVELTKPNTVHCDAQNPPFLTVLVLTLHANVGYRDAIRKTWGTVAPKVIFLVGKNKNNSLNAKVKEEAERTKDIVMFDFQESYFNLTYKVLMGYKWIKEHCNGTKYVMKVDEDTFMNMPEILNKLKSPAWKDKICGPYYTSEHCQRKGKYKVLVSAYPFEFYAPHVKGNMYVMPKYIAMKLLYVSYYMPYCNMEDAYITGILAKAAGGFQYQNILGTEYNPSAPVKGCAFIKSQKLVSQSFKPDDFKVVWDLLQKKNHC